MESMQHGHCLYHYITGQFELLTVPIYVAAAPWTRRSLDFCACAARDGLYILPQGCCNEEPPGGNTKHPTLR